MDWQAFATQTEADLGKADQANTELKQEVRELKKKLIAAPKTDSLQQQLTKAQQEVADYKDRYVKHLQDLQSQLAASTQAREDAEDRTAKAELASKETVKQLHALTCRFEEDQAETQKLKESLVEQEKALQQARQQHAATAQKPTAASAVSYQQHIEMLHRQLNIFKTENARLVNHSTRNKLGNGEDDSEPEYPRYVFDPMVMVGQGLIRRQSPRTDKEQDTGRGGKEASTQDHPSSGEDQTGELRRCSFDKAAQGCHRCSPEPKCFVQACIKSAARRTASRVR